MGSWIKCACGETFNKNLYAGNNVFFLIDEDTTEAIENGTLSIHDALGRVDHAVKCRKCSRLHIYGPFGTFRGVFAVEPG